MALVLLTQPTDEANGLPVVLAEEQLDLLHVALTLWQRLRAQLWGVLPCQGGLTLQAVVQVVAGGPEVPGNKRAAADAVPADTTNWVSFLGVAEGTCSLALWLPWGQ